MTGILILAVGKMRGGDAELCEEYKKRLTGAVAIKEIATGTQASEGAALLKAIPPKSFVVLLDEGGKNISSRELAAHFARWQARDHLVFIIGGADGLTDDLRARADFTLAFGTLTWPHRLARVMLLEQLYRAQQIKAGHPYHRD